MEDFRHYCLKLAASNPIIATDEAVKKFNDLKKVVKWYQEDFKAWNEKHEVKPIFNLTHLYEKEVQRTNKSK